MQRAGGCTTVLQAGFPARALTRIHSLFRNLPRHPLFTILGAVLTGHEVWGRNLSGPRSLPKQAHVAYPSWSSRASAQEHSPSCGAAALTGREHWAPCGSQPKGHTHPQGDASGGHPALEEPRVFRLYPVSLLCLTL